ncbi:MAG: hypothetical protein RBT81_13540, partial [Gammaproteobacteria bacterium]|nr:hypothetical protein [Gammaproteobacteria bacterium]
EDTLQNLREQALRIIIDSKLSDDKKLAAIKMMAPDEAVEKLNLANFKKYAERNAMPFHIPMAPTNEKVLNTLERIAPTYRDTTRDVSKKPVVPQERQAGGRSLFQRSLTAPWGRSLTPRDHQILNQPFHKFQDARLRAMAIRIKNSVADPVEGRALARQFRADVQATSTQSAKTNFRASDLTPAQKAQYDALTTDAQRKQYLARASGVMTDGQMALAGSGGVNTLTPEQYEEYKALTTDKARMSFLAQARGVKARQPKPAPVSPAKTIENAEARAMKYLEYLNNPPDSYEPKHAVGIRRWANTVLAESTDEGVRSAVRTLLKKAESVIEGDQSLTALEGTAGSEVPAQAPKSQSKPAGARKLNGRSPYLAKDQRKADQATKFIGRGSPASSTAQYARDLKDIANTGQYTADDVVFISAEGARTDRVDPDFTEIRKAVKAGATFITDDASSRGRPYNVGERQVAKFLVEEGYRESAPGRWTPAQKTTGADWSGQGRKLNAMATQIHNDLGRSGFAATHDSPIRHEGRFDWRAHLGKGEGNAAFGAGTYLSTAEGVHKSYKSQFTAMMIGDSRFKGLVGMHALDVLNRIRAEMPSAGMARVFSAAEAELDELATNGPAAIRPVYRLALKDIRADREAYERALDAKSPTYEVSVDIAPEQLLDWDAPLNEQSELVQKALRTVERDLGTQVDGATGADLYKHLAEVLAQRADDAADSFKEMAEVNGQALASDYLQSLGILGHKYASSGGKNDKHPNYVIYDDSKITTNYVHFNAQANGPYSGWKAGTPSTDKEVAEAKAYIDRVLGPKIKVDFEKTMGHSGEWIEASETIKIALNAAAGILPTA